MKWLAVLTGLALAAIAAWFSIVGLMAIFAAAAIPVAIMAGALEIGKLVITSILYRHRKRLPKLLVGYLGVAVVVLILITSMGIFGFLSKAHIEQTAPTGNITAQIEQLDFRIQQEKGRIDRANGILAQLDAAIERYIKLDRITRGLKKREEQKEERAALRKEVDSANQQITVLTEQRFKLQRSIRNVELEVGPIRYVAELFAGKSDSSTLEATVRWLIIVFVFVIDPVAVLLIIAANRLWMREGVQVVGDKWKPIDVPEPVRKTVKEKPIPPIIDSDPPEGVVMPKSRRSPTVQSSFLVDDE